MGNNHSLSIEELHELKTRDDLLVKLNQRNYPLERILKTIEYEEQLLRLQTELVKLQRWVIENNRKLAIIFEGRDAAGKGGAIRRFISHLNPRGMRVVALAKPTPIEKGQWYFRRYIKELPNTGEIVFFDRSWYNRAVVEPAMKFCTKKEYQKFLLQAPEFEHMIYEDGVDLIKFWFSISKDEQMVRFESRENNKLKQWKLSPVDKKAQKMWDEFSNYKEEMFIKTHTSYSPWIIVQADDKKVARLESIRYVLSRMDYTGKDNEKTFLDPDPNYVMRYHRQAYRL
jgi:polyphosphate kinase 2